MVKKENNGDKGGDLKQGKNHNKEISFVVFLTQKSFPMSINFGKKPKTIKTQEQSMLMPIQASLGPYKSKKMKIFEYDKPNFEKS